MCKYTDIQIRIGKTLLQDKKNHEKSRNASIKVDKFDFEVLSKKDNGIHLIFKWHVWHLNFET